MIAPNHPPDFYECGGGFLPKLTDCVVGLQFFLPFIIA